MKSISKCIGKDLKIHIFRDLLNLYKKTSSRLSTGRLVSKYSMRRMLQLCTLRPHIGDAKELEVVDAMDAEDHG